MLMDPKRTPLKKSTLLVALGYLSSIVLAIAGRIWGIPWLLCTIPKPILAFLAAIALVPVLPSLALILQQRAPASVRMFLILYTEELVALLFELLFIVLVLPLVILQGLNIGALMVLAALAIGFMLWLVQELLGIATGISVSRQDMTTYLIIFLALAAGELILFFVRKSAEKNTENVFKSILNLRAHISKSIKSHRHTQNAL